MGLGTGIYAGRRKFAHLAKEMILKDTATLNIPKEVYNRFFTEVDERNAWGIFSSAQQVLIRCHYYGNNSIFRLPYYSYYEIYRSKIIGTFLLSTDFFVNKMDESKTLTYISFFDPYRRSCGNPFSNLYYP